MKTWLGGREILFFSLEITASPYNFKAARLQLFTFSSFDNIFPSAGDLAGSETGSVLPARALISACEERKPSRPGTSLAGGGALTWLLLNALCCLQGGAERLILCKLLHQATCSMKSLWGSGLGEGGTPQGPQQR